MTTDKGRVGEDHHSQLYKTKMAEQICWTSYDRAMQLVSADYTDDWVTTEFGTTHLITLGPEDAEPLVLIPGLFADATMWYANLEQLARDFRVYALDMINFGGKSVPLGTGIKKPADYVAWFISVIAELGIDRTAVAGLSYGSWVALTIAQTQPDVISALILLDPSESFVPMDGGIAWRGFWSFLFFPNRQKYASFFQWIGGGYTDPQMEIWFQHLLDVIEHGTARMQDMPRKLYTQEELVRVTMPVLVMAGGKPILYKDPKVLAQAVHAALSQAEVIIVPDAGHGLNMEKAVTVNSKILDFLNPVHQ